MHHKKDLILCIDMGTSTLKVALFDKSKKCNYFKIYKHSTKQRLPYNLNFLRDCEPGIAQVSLVSMSCQAPSIVPILKNGCVGTPIFYYTKEKYPKRDDCESVFLPQVIHHKKNFPHEYTNIKTYLTLGDYLIYLFTGHFCTSLICQEYQKFVWDPQQIESYNLDEKQFPDPIIWPNYVGKTKKNLPIPPNIRVIACNYDFLAASIGLKTNSPFIAVDRAGSSLALNFFIPQKQLQFVKERLPCKNFQWSIYPHIYANAYNAGIIFQDFNIFLEQLIDIFPEDYENSNKFEDLFKKILDPISNINFTEPPQTTDQSFLKLWNQFADVNSPILKAQQVFIEYSKVLYQCLVEWPLGPITEVRASGGPNLNKTFVKFKSQITKIPWKLPPIIHAELLGNFKVAQKILKS